MYLVTCLIRLNCFCFHVMSSRSHPPADSRGSCKNTLSITYNYSGAGCSGRKPSRIFKMSCFLATFLASAWKTSKGKQENIFWTSRKKKRQNVFKLEISQYFFLISNNILINIINVFITLFILIFPSLIHFHIGFLMF